MPIRGTYTACEHRDGVVETEGMETGLLWFDDSPRVSLTHKVLEAARRYREKFGRCPNVCYVHPSMLAASGPAPAEVRVVKSSSVQPNHFWVGVQ